MPILRIPHDLAISEHTRVAAEHLLTGDARQGTANVYSDASSQFHCGIWQAEPATWRVSYREHEFCHILEGRIRITDDQGAATDVGPGDSFVVPTGFVGIWQVLEKARKIYVIFEPKPASQ